MKPKKLDDKSYREILDAARAAITDYGSGWTDLNAHDPGVTLLELLSFLTEMQRYYIERAAEPSVFFPLLGVEPYPAAPAAADALLSPEDGKRLTLPEYTELRAVNVRFETAYSVELGEGGEAVRLEQRHTVCPPYMRAGELNGFPNQRLKLEIDGKRIIRESFALMVSEDGEPGHAVKWERTESLHRSGPYDRYYTLDEDTGEIAFGDGFRGRMPKGIAIITSMALTEGGGGNIKAGRLGDFTYAGHRISVRQPHHAQGGRERESGKDALERVLSSFERAVTAEDYERLVRSVPGLDAEYVSAFSTQGETSAPFSVTVAVKPRGDRAALSEQHVKLIIERLEPFRLACTEIRVVPPAYVELRVTAELHHSVTDSGEVAPAVEAKLREFLERRYGGFGARIRHGEVFAFLDTLPETETALSLTLTAEGPDAEDDGSGGLILGPACIAVPGRIDVIVV